MNIGLIAVDGRHKYPNYALMKLATYHRQLGDNVEWADPMFGNYDRVYASKVFNFSPDFSDIYRCEVIKGGTGYDIYAKLPTNVEYLQPDYSIYPEIDNRTSYGFITRGCTNKCPWCVVPRKEGNIHAYMDIDDITQGGARPYAILMDNNILASDFGVEQLVKIADKAYHIDLNQGNSARLVTPEVGEILARIHWQRNTIRFAADTPKQIAEVERAMQLIDKHRQVPLNYLIYTMIDGDIEACYQRLSYWRKFPRVRIVAQPYRDPDNKIQRIPQWQRDMARWSMRRELYTSCDFKAFSPRKNFKCNEYFITPQ